MIGEVLDRAIDQRLAGYARQDDVTDCTGRIAWLEEAFRCLQGEQIAFRQEFYTTEEVGLVMGVKAGTVRKNYIKTGRIKASMCNGIWVIPREEYMRVAEIVKTRGVNWL